MQKLRGERKGMFVANVHLSFEGLVNKVIGNKHFVVKHHP